MPAYSTSLHLYKHLTLLPGSVLHLLVPASHTPCCIQRLQPRAQLGQHTINPVTIALLQPLRAAGMHAACANISRQAGTRKGMATQCQHWEQQLRATCIFTSPGSCVMPDNSTG